MVRKTGLDDPQVASIAWGRFRRLMGWMALSGLLCVAAVLGVLYLMGTPMPPHMIIATSAGVWFTFMLGTGLMSLLFLSSGTGHDEQISDLMKLDSDRDFQD